MSGLQFISMCTNDYISNKNNIYPRETFFNFWTAMWDFPQDLKHKELGTWQQRMHISYPKHLDFTSA